MEGYRQKGDLLGATESGPAKLFSPFFECAANPGK